MRLFKEGFPTSAVTAAVLLAFPAVSQLAGWVCRIDRSGGCDAYVPALLAVNVRKVIQGAPLYGDLRRPPYGSMLFGPVVPWLTAPLARLFGSDPLAPLEAGRVLTICASIAVCLLIFRLGRRAGAGPSAALIAAMAFLISPVMEVWGFEFRPDMPALAFELGGIASFEAGLAYPAVAMFVLAFLSKQTRVAGIAAVVLYCWMKGDRKRAITLASAWFTALILVAAAIEYVYPYFWLNNYRALTPLYDLPAIPTLFGAMIRVDFLLYALAAAGIVRKGLRQSLPVWFALVALLGDALSSTHWGSNLNYFLPSLAGAAIVAAPELDHLVEQCRELRMPAQVLAGAAIAWAIACHTGMGYAAAGCDCPKSSVWDAQMLNVLHSTHGVVLTNVSELVLMNASSHVEFLDLMALGNMKSRGTFDDRELISAIEDRKIAAIALDYGLLSRGWRGRFFFWPELSEAIRRNYVVLGSPSGLPPFVALPRKVATP